MKLMNILYLILAIIGINYIVSSIMNLLGVQIQYYINYLLWFFAVLLFVFILPADENYFS